MTVCPFQPTLFPSLYVFNRAWQADTFVLMISAQFCAANKKEDGTKGKTGQKHMRVAGSQPVAWLGVPIVKELQPIKNTELKPSTEWRDNLMNELYIRYNRTPYFSKYAPAVEYILRTAATVGELNSACFRWGHQLFELNCDIKEDIEVCEKTAGNDWVFSMVSTIGGPLITGKPSLNYLDTKRYEDANIGVIVQNWTCQPYTQISTGWTPGLSMLDALFNIGAEQTALIVKTK